jgi:hypothetical protein
MLLSTRLQQLLYEASERERKEQKKKRRIEMVVGMQASMTTNVRGCRNNFINACL